MSRLSSLSGSGGVITVPTVLTSTGPLITPITIVADPAQTAPLFTLQAGKVATAIANVNSPSQSFVGSWWNGAIAQPDTYAFQVVIGAGANPGTTLVLAHTGSPNGGNVNFPSTINLGGSLNTGGGVTSGASVAIQGNTPATAISNFVFGAFKASGFYWDGAASQPDLWTLTNTLGAGANPTTTLTLAHTGTPGAANFNFGPGFGIQYNGALAAQILTKRITLTSAQILTLNTVPTQILPPLGGNLTYAVVASTLHYHFGTVPYAGGSSYIIFSPTTSVVNMWTAGPISGTIQAGADTIYSSGSGTYPGTISPTFIDTKGLGLYVCTNVGDPSAGDGTLTIEVQYRIFDASLT